MARLIAVANQKGGVGKTTVSVGLASVLAEAGTPCTVVDVDPQQSAADWLSTVKGTPVPFVVERDADRLRDMARLPASVVIADTPGSLEGADTLHAVAVASDFMVIPAEPSQLSLKPLIRTIREIVQPSGVPYRVLLSKVRPQAAGAAREARAMLTDAGIACFGAHVRLLVAHEKAPSYHRLITTMPGGSGAADDLRKVSLELVTILTGLQQER